MSENHDDTIPLDPTKVQLRKVPPPDPKQVAELTKAFNNAIRAAEASGVWPAVVPQSRDAMTRATIEFVAAAFGGVGWEMNISPANLSARALIWHPAAARGTLRPGE